MLSSTGPSLRDGSTPPPPLWPDWRQARLLASRLGQKGVGFQGLSSLAFDASLGLFGGLSWPPLADFGLTWRRLACFGSPWPRLAWLRALRCLAMGFLTLRSYWPWRYILRVQLSHSKPEIGRQGSSRGLWPGIWHPWSLFGWLLECNSATKFDTKNHGENGTLRPPKFGVKLRIASPSFSG